MGPRRFEARLGRQEDVPSNGLFVLQTIVMVAYVVYEVLDEIVPR